ncbi:MAG: hypothetical protein JXA89_08435 [Anaerolineae bacterium]|nr:hypothetical protein [Anaerolineae bacterium]
MYLIIRLLEKYALWVYIACGVGMIVYLRIALAARREGTYALFTLERAQAAKRIYRASWMILILLLIVVGVYVLVNYVQAAPPPIVVDETSIPEADTTTTVTPTRPQPTSALSTSTPAPTLTRRPRDTTIVIPTLPAQQTPTSQTQAAPAACPHPNVQVTQPGQNLVIDAGVQVVGTAFKDNFDRYEFKFKNMDIEDEWHWVETFTTPVENGNLGYWVTSHLPAGNYRFMLIAIDKMGNSQECTVPVIIKH